MTGGRAVLALPHINGEKPHGRSDQQHQHVAAGTQMTALAAVQSHWPRTGPPPPAPARRARGARPSAAAVSAAQPARHPPSRARQAAGPASPGRVPRHWTRPSRAFRTTSSPSRTVTLQVDKASGESLREDRRRPDQAADPADPFRPGPGHGTEVAGNGHIPRPPPASWWTRRAEPSGSRRHHDLGPQSVQPQHQQFRRQQLRRDHQRHQHHRSDPGGDCPGQPAHGAAAGPADRQHQPGPRRTATWSPR